MNFKEILQQTTFFSSGLNIRQVSRDTSLESNAGALWAWHHYGGIPHLIKDIRCKTESMEHNHACDTKMPALMDARVLDTLEWRDIEITTIHGHYTLPLTLEYILAKFTTDGGEITNQYQPVNIVEGGVFTVFGYEFNTQSNAFVPISSDALEDDNFFNAESEDPVRFIPVTLKKEEGLQIFVQPCRMLVCLEFICCEINNDYEPTGAGNVARMFPRSYIIGNRSYRVNKAQTRFLRPAETNRAGKVDVVSDDMTQDYHTGYYTDSNNESPIVEGIGGPKWSSLFSWYAFDDTREYHMVRAMQQYERNESGILPLLGRFTYEYSDCNVTKMPHQGAFDSIHMAPQMIAPFTLKEEWAKDPFGVMYRTLDAVNMAPICQHDCFHMHWRWGVDYTKFHNKGYDENGGYQVSGATMIPANQDLYVQCPAGNEMLYTVKIPGIVDPMKWQVTCDHGAGYLVSVNRLVKLSCMGIVSVNALIMQASLETAIKKPLINARSWAMLYWNLRYARTPLGPKERVKLTPGLLKRLTEL
jgi:hypothetical protein